MTSWDPSGLKSASDSVVELPGSAGHEVIYAESIAQGKAIGAMTVEEIYASVEKFAEGAWRVQQAGFDCVELHGAHGYLIAQFMSPYVNKRNDRFGGSFINRMRFVLEIMARIRHKCGRDFPIGLRYIRIGSRDDSADVSAPRRARAAFSACSSRISSSIGSGSSGMSGSSIKSSPSSSIALIRLSTMAGSPPSSGSHS